MEKLKKIKVVIVSTTFFYISLNSINIMEKNEVCEICNRPITNPLCNRCRTKHFVLWLNDYDIEIEKRLFLTKKIREKFFFESSNESECILCKNEIVSTCTYCYFLKVEKLMKELRLPRKMLEDYTLVFNYRLYGEEPFFEIQIINSDIKLKTTSLNEK